MTPDRGDDQRRRADRGRRLPPGRHHDQHQLADQREPAEQLRRQHPGRAQLHRDGSSGTARGLP